MFKTFYNNMLGKYVIFIKIFHQSGNHKVQREKTHTAPPTKDNNILANTLSAYVHIQEYGQMDNYLEKNIITSKRIL